MTNLAKILCIPLRNQEQQPKDQSIDVTARERRARWVVVALLIGALGLFWAGASLYRNEEEAGLRSLPAQVRRGLYTRTLDEVETVCRSWAASSEKLRAHCVAQARFLQSLPECTDACQRTAARVRPYALR